MKKFLIASNVILFVAVVILFFLHFTHGRHSTDLFVKQGVVSPAESASPAAFKIGYFELDSLDNNYKYEQDVQNELIASEKKMEAQISDLQNQVQSRYNEIQKKASTMTQAEQLQYSNEINALVRQNQDKAQRLQQSMAMERDAKLHRVKQAIQSYLKTYAKENSFNYIIGTSFDTDNFYYKDSAQNITSQLIKNLNQQYADSSKNAHK